MQQYYDNLRNRVEEFLPTALRETFPVAEVMEPARYSVLAGGKRLRPVLVLHTARNRLDALYAAAAVEFVHTSSLIHDDLPAMDDDDLRRGRPTLHKVAGEAVAILAGDALAVGAFKMLARYGGRLASSLTATLASAYLDMVAGQIWDSVDEHAPPRTEEALMKVYDHKTGALLTASLVMGAMISGEDAMLEWLPEFGRIFGRLFQATDDLLDAIGEESVVGKTTGTDEREGRLTAVTLLGVEGARSLVGRLRQEALELLDDRDPFLRWLVDLVADRDR